MSSVSPVARIIPARAGFTLVVAVERGQVEDHPRSRGVYQSALNDLASATGSSPLARGLHVRAPLDFLRSWIIPARAGFTWLTWTPSRGLPDHPRSRGVYAVEREEVQARRGSSPLARGLLLGPLDRVSPGRIIPARAGFTNTSPSGRSTYVDHPRSRGVYGLRLADRVAKTGSSPLARGLLRLERQYGIKHGIIPARAGFTQYPWPTRCRRADHPRSRGVYRDAVMRPGPSLGSSPLARGLPCPGRGMRRCWRIIPARAGFTSRMKPLGCSFRDHPRSRGVYKPVTVRSAIEDGIIPARAGFTRKRPCPRKICSDHPRSRGVYGTQSAIMNFAAGSSPLARGLRLSKRSLRASRRIIPARAGFTHRRTCRRPYRPDHPRSRGVYCTTRASRQQRTGSSPLARGLHLAIGVIPTVGHPTRGRSPSLVT